MMFERYKASFNWASSSERSEGSRPLRKAAPEAEPTSPPRAPALDLPFDRKLRQQLLEDARPEPALPGPSLPEAALPEPRRKAPAVAAGADEAGDHLPKNDMTAPRTGRGTTGRALLVPGSWDVLRPARPGQKHLLGALRMRSDEVRRATDTLRTQLLQTLKANGWRRIAVSAPTSGCGTTFTALNLALSMAAVPDVKTVLLDLDQRRPGLARALDAAVMQSAADWLGGKVAFMDYLQRFADNLAIGLTAEATEAPAEILQAGAAAEALDAMDEALDPDVTICDLPPLLEHDDLLAFAPRVDAVLIVADATATTAAQIAECQRLLEGRAPFLGVVLNRGRVGARRPRG